MIQTKLEAALETGLYGVGYSLSRRKYKGDFIIAKQVDDVFNPGIDRLSEEEKFLRSGAGEFSFDQFVISRGYPPTFKRSLEEKNFRLVYYLHTDPQIIGPTEMLDEMIKKRSYSEYLGLGLGLQEIPTIIFFLIENMDKPIIAFCLDIIKEENRVAENFAIQKRLRDIDNRKLDEVKLVKIVLDLIKEQE